MTIDHVNPEAPWPDLELLRAGTESRGHELVPRLTVYPRYIDGAWIEPVVMPHVLRASDSLGLAREDPWSPGEDLGRAVHSARRAAGGTHDEPRRGRAVRLFRARGSERDRVFAAADRLRREVNGDTVSYVVTRNIQYTNVGFTFRAGVPENTATMICGRNARTPSRRPQNRVLRPVLGVSSASSRSRSRTRA